MLKSKKLITIIMLAALTIGAAVPAYAANYVVDYAIQPVSHNTTLPGHDNWNRGIRNPGTGYVMCFSYYYNDSYNHMSKATLNGKRFEDRNYAGATSCANSESERSDYGVLQSAGIGVY